MSVKSKKSSKVGKAIDRPFDPGVLRRARQLAEAYQIVLRQEDGEFYGRAIEMPDVMNDGKTADECVEKTRDILTTSIAYLIEAGKNPPPPASEERRTEQVNVRLTAEEKYLLEEAARSRGFRGISDFVRSSTLSQLR
jgi:predicted RNase H-like HicB family nuclease